MGHQDFWYNVMQLQGHSSGTRDHKEEVAQHDPPSVLLTLLCQMLMIQTCLELYKSSYVLGKCILNTYMCIDNYYSYVILCACVPLYRVTLAYIQCIQYIKVAMSWVSVYLIHICV